MEATKTIADLGSLYSLVVLVVLLRMCSCKDGIAAWSGVTSRGTSLLDFQRPCDDLYVVGEGDTLQTISDKCGDPFIVERNPHIHDPDDVFPGIVIKITPSSNLSR